MCQANQCRDSHRFRNSCPSNSVCNRRRTSVLKVVAPAPTGSSTHGFPRLLATVAACSMLATQSAESVPTLITSASACFTNSSTSSKQCT